MPALLCIARAVPAPMVKCTRNAVRASIDVGAVGDPVAAALSCHRSLVLSVRSVFVSAGVDPPVATCSRKRLLPSGVEHAIQNTSVSSENIVRSEY